MGKNEEKFVQLVNPSGMKVGVAESRVKSLLNKGFRMAGEGTTAAPEPSDTVEEPTPDEELTVSAEPPVDEEPKKEEKKK